MTILCCPIILTGPVVTEDEADVGGAAEVFWELTLAFVSSSCMAWKKVEDTAEGY